MSKFDELMKKPLPSQSKSNAVDMLAAIEADLGITTGDEVEETFDDIDSLSGTAPVSTEEDGEMGAGDPPEQDESDPGSAEEGVDTDDIEDVDDEGDFDPDDLDDSELLALDKELTGDGVGGDEEEHLTPEEEIKADDMMSVAATTMLVNDELSGDEKKEFCTSDIETGIVVREGFMTEADINDLAVACGALTTEAPYTNKMIIRLDAASKKKQLYALAVNVSAAAHNDPEYYKYKKIMKMKKIQRAKLERRYHGEAMKRMKVYYARLRKSKSKTMNKLAK